MAEQATDKDSRVPVIDAQGLVKTYKMGDIEVHALCGVSLRIYAGELASIMGPSGSGKTTLMNILGCLDQATSGVYKLDGVDVDRLNDNQLAAIRNKKIGFVFQSFNLLRRTPAIENVEQPLIYAGVGMRQRRERARQALEAVGLGDRLKHHANELSGGQQQRVAIARAIVANPSLILADEPTGNLDSKSGEEIMCLFQRLNEESGITVIFVTHDLRIASHTRRIVRIADGQLTGDSAVDDQILACPEPLDAGMAVAAPAGTAR
ncbi:MAG: ABC transporter ATP-binding protein [Chloroflexi bacterium]|nr:ABC transporter ATP-binding protein [Chloroflexota bacterium]MCL5275155.1 ABC transporter ATP-binding protein [Chloroflexota bacterium]